jgi:Na+-transporting NADH:ubiquinone oxidoreductase subunit NqrB
LAASIGSQHCGSQHWPASIGITKIVETAEKNTRNRKDLQTKKWMAMVMVMVVMVMVMLMVMMMAASIGSQHWQPALAASIGQPALALPKSLKPQKKNTRNRKDLQQKNGW